MFEQWNCKSTRELFFFFPSCFLRNSEWQIWVGLLYSMFYSPLTTQPDGLYDINTTSVIYPLHLSGGVSGAFAYTLVMATLSVMLINQSLCHKGRLAGPPLLLLCHLRIFSAGILSRVTNRVTTSRSCRSRFPSPFLPNTDFFNVFLFSKQH